MKLCLFLSLAVGTVPLPILEAFKEVKLAPLIAGKAPDNFEEDKPVILASAIEPAN